METLEEKLAKLNAMEIREQFGIIHLCPFSCIRIAIHTGDLPIPGWYRETVVMEAGSEWEGPYDTAQEALAYNTKH